MNRTYCTHIPKWFHPNHHGQLQNQLVDDGMPISLHLGSWRDGFTGNVARAKVEKKNMKSWRRRCWSSGLSWLSAWISFWTIFWGWGGNGAFWTLIDFSRLGGYAKRNSPSQSYLDHLEDFRYLDHYQWWRTELESNCQIEPTILIQNHPFKWTLPKS